MPLSDHQLVERARRGAEDASRELVERYERPVFNLVLRMVREPAVAEELAQDAFVKAFQRLDTFDPAYKFSNWVLKIAHNTTIDYLRRQRPTLVPLDDVDEEESQRLAGQAQTPPDPFESAQRADLAAALERALERLRPEYRQVIVLRYQEDLSYDDIAEVTGLPLGTIKSHLHRARQAMAELLSDSGWAPQSGPSVQRADTSTRRTN
jgi:RNA polymerase sigma-70 factor, ECF subfamily